MDVAAAAGVSKSTVSNVLQGKGPVHEATRQRVLDAIARLGYQPNAGARSMRQRSRILGVVVGDLRNPFHAELASHIEEHAALRDHTILLALTGGDAERELERVRTLVEHRVAGLVFVSFPCPEALSTVGPDTSTVFASITMPGAMSIAVDDRAGTQLSVEHLAQLGHRHIGFVSVTLDEPRTEVARFDGYRRTMKKAGLTIRESDVLRPQRRRNGSAPSYQEALHAFLSHDRRPTAVVASTDFDALELISAADALGIVVPDQLSLVGFDNINVAGHSRMSLTTIAQPMREIARLAVDTAIDGVPPGNGARRRSGGVRLPPELIVRGSTAPPGGPRRPPVRRASAGRRQPR